LSFKPDSDDVRDSPAANIIRLLIREGYTHFNAYDPVANVQFDSFYRFEHICYCSAREEVCQNSDIIVVVTAWQEFKNLRSAFPNKTLIDCRYCVDSVNSL